ncbi:hypothetical protein EBB07_27150 [Paenibacillaceae bacterium]|nr:hypothetical protein EBB07_27150 [Paenibacillaceae bacterium]
MFDAIAKIRRNCRDSQGELAKGGYTLEHVVSTDVAEPSKFVNNRRADANFMQTQAYLGDFIEGTKIKNLERAFYVGFMPVGLYSNMYKTIEEISDGASCVHISLLKMNMITYR